MNTHTCMWLQQNCFGEGLIAISMWDSIPTVVELRCCNYGSCHVRLMDGRFSNFTLQDHSLGLNGHTVWNLVWHNLELHHWCCTIVVRRPAPQYVSNVPLQLKLYLINPRRACTSRITCVCVCSFSVFCLLALLGVQRGLLVATARKMEQKWKAIFSKTA